MAQRVSLPKKILFHTPPVVGVFRAIFRLMSREGKLVREYNLRRVGILRASNASEQNFRRVAIEILSRMPDKGQSKEGKTHKKQKSKMKEELCF